jgi:hypothetical protein
MKNYIAGIIVLALFITISLAAAEEPKVGFVKNVSGKAFIERNKIQVPAKPKDILMINDTLITGREGSLGVIFQDDSVLSLGPNSRLVITKFQFDPAEKKLSLVARVKKGTLVYLTGLITKLNPGAAQFITPTAVCGARGTRFAIKVEDSGE